MTPGFNKNPRGNKSSKLVFSYYLYQSSTGSPTLGHLWRGQSIEMPITQFSNVFESSVGGRISSGVLTDNQMKWVQLVKPVSLFTSLFALIAISCFNHKTKLNNKVFKNVWYECIYFCFLFGKILSSFHFAFDWMFDLLIIKLTFELTFRELRSLTPSI